MTKGRLDVYPMDKTLQQLIGLAANGSVEQLGGRQRQGGCGVVGVGDA